jgi:tubulin polyglutamylase TTLL6/13
MHLTNYAINKNSENFIFNKKADMGHIGHKRSLTSVLELLKEKGMNTVKLLADMK